MNTAFLLLAKYQKPRLALKDIADLMSITVETARNQIYAGRLPIPTYKEGANTFADIRDVAEYLDKMREEAREAADRLSK